MNEFQLALAIAAVGTVILSSNIKRAGLWVIMAGISFIASTVYEAYNFPHPPFFTALCDASVCLMIYFIATRKWEMWIYRIFQCSVLVSLCYLMGVIGPHYAYIVALELLNWGALFVIGGTAVLQWIGARGGHRSILGLNPRGNIRDTYLTLQSKRADNPFFRKQD